MREDLRIGVYVCHCGLNIAAGVDVAQVAEYAATLPGVVLARDHKYTCSIPGQTHIAEDIQAHGLNRVVVAACSPLLHEQTFRRAIENAGLNPFYLQMVNIREHAAWVHADRAEATEKAKDMVRGAVRRVALHQALQKRRLPVRPDVLVVGGGIAGLHAALTIANAGKRVYLVEREPSIGGNMARYDKTFPTLECSACILSPKMTAVANHPNITLWTYSEVESVSGYVGNYSVRVRRHARYIREDRCVGCMQCLDACVYDGPPIADAFNLGLGSRKPVYLPFSLAAPRIVTVDPQTCWAFAEQGCERACVDACGERGAFDFSQEDTIEQAEVGSIVVATGFQPFDASRAPEYGYGLYPNV